MCFSEQNLFKIYIYLSNMSLIGVHISRITTEIPSVFLREDAQSGSLKTCRVLYRFTDQNKKLQIFIFFNFSQVQGVHSFISIQFCNSKIDILQLPLTF